MILFFAYIATFISASCYSLGSILQQIATHRVKPMTSLRPTGLFVLFRQIPYVVGLVFDAAGFVLYLIVSHIMPLFFVQSVLSFGIVVTAILSRFILGKRLLTRDYRLIGLIVVGLLLVSFAASPDAARPASHFLKVAITVMPIILVIVAVSLTKFLHQKAMLAAFMGGLSFSGVAIVSRMIDGRLDPLSVITNPLSWALVVYAVLGLTLFSMALQNGLVTHVDALIYVIEIIIPTIIGLSFLGDHPRPGTAPVMYGGLLIVIISIAALALSHQRSVGTRTVPD